MTADRGEKLPRGLALKGALLFLAMFSCDRVYRLNGLTYLVPIDDSVVGR